MGKRKAYQPVPLFVDGHRVPRRHVFPWGASFLGMTRDEILKRFGKPKGQRCPASVSATHKRTGKVYSRKCGRSTLRDEFGRPKEFCREHEEPIAIKMLAEMEPLSR